MKYDVFISYRREGGYDTAKHLNDLLVRDGYKVSFDIDTLRNGNFDTQLLERINQCKDFILIVDQHAFDRTLNPNFNHKNDWMRCELAYALKKNKNIIPVFLSGVNGFPDNLPPDISKVVLKNGPEFNRYHFNSFYDILKKRFLHKKNNLPKIVLYAFILFCLLFVAILFLYNSMQNSSNRLANTTPHEMISSDVESPDKEKAREEALRTFCGRYTLTEKAGSFNHITELELDPINSSCEKIIEGGNNQKIVNITKSIGFYGTEMQMIAYWEILSFNLSNDMRSALVELIYQTSDEVHEVEKARLELDEYNNIKFMWLNKNSSEEYFVRSN